MTWSAHVADPYSNDFSSCIFQNYPSALVTGFESGMSSGCETCVVSGWGTCSPWISESSSPQSLYREHHDVPALVGNHYGSEIGSVTWTHLR
jgi:hypothetical protein